MRKYFIVGVVALVFLTVLGTGRAEAVPARFRIVQVSCHGEFVDIKNVSPNAASLVGYRVFDGNRVHRFDIPDDPNAVLPAGARVRIWAANKHGGPIVRWFTGWRGPIFADTGDRARLVNPNHDQISAMTCGDATPPSGGGGGGGGGNC